jgi:hypothetical protein
LFDSFFSNIDHFGKPSLFLGATCLKSVLLHAAPAVFAERPLLISQAMSLFPRSSERERGTFGSSLRPRGRKHRSGTCDGGPRVPLCRTARSHRA